MPRTPRRWGPSPEELKRAIYIDFEGFENEAPALLGILLEGRYEVVVLDPRLADAARVKGLRVSTLRHEIERLLEECASASRLLVAYSQHELVVIRKYCGLDVTPWYVDARKVARRWWNRAHPGEKLASRALKDLLRLVGYPRPPHLGERKSTHRLRGVLEGLARRGSFDALTPVAKAKFTKLVDHNEHDCRGMEYVLRELLP